MNNFRVSSLTIFNKENKNNEEDFKQSIRNKEVALHSAIVLGV